MFRTLDISSWPRKKTYLFFREYDHPFFNVCADVDVTHLYNSVKERNASFFIASLFCSLKAANELEPFRYRLKGEEVIICDTVSAGSTVLNEDETFGFCYFDYRKEYPEFERLASQTLAQYKAGDLKMDARDDMLDVIHYSVLPWVSFTSFSHARRMSKEDSIPKIVFGKYREEKGEMKMPVSVEVHHALMDGLHMGRYFQNLQQALSEF